jgi:hypothetical protein
MSFSFEFDAAIASHKSWLQRLEFMLDGIDVDGVEIENVGDTHHCSLGAWISGPGARFSELRSFHHLEAAHTAFHTQAAAVVRLWRNEQHAEADELLKGVVTELSTEVALLIESLKREHHGTS